MKVDAQKSRFSLAVIIIVFLLSFSCRAASNSLDISDDPLFLGENVAPNIFFVVDDSGSMDWEVMSSPHWHSCAYDSNSPSDKGSYDCGWEVTNGLWRGWANNNWRYFYYLYDNSDNAYFNTCNSYSGSNIQKCSGTNPVEHDWRLLSAGLNKIYYTPDSLYKPPQAPCSKKNLCSDASFNSARSNYHSSQSGYNIKKSLVDDINYSSYEVWIDNKGFNAADGRPQRGNNLNVTSTANNKIDLWDSHVRITFGSGSVTVQSIDYSPDSSGLNPTIITRATLNGNSQCYNILGDENLVKSIHTGTLAYNSVDAEGCRTINQAKQNFANWYQYYRKRSYATKMAISSVINQFPQFRFGLTVLNNHLTLFKLLPDKNTINYSDHNSDILQNLNSLRWTASGTPLRQGLERAGKYYNNQLGEPDPIIHSCQQNFTLLLTDGFWNGGSPSSSIGDSDGDTLNRTLADTAHYYYITDLSPLPDEVVTNAFDPAMHQHMVTFGIAFGVSGDLVDTDDDGWPNPVLTESSSWGNPYQTNPGKIDDLWHAAFNSKGKYIAAQTPQKVAESLKTTLIDIAERIGSMASVANNAATLSADSKIYQAQFDTNGWAGKLLAYQISSTGIVNDTPEWDAGCKLTGGTCANPNTTYTGKAANDRVILTKQPDNDGIAFRFPVNYKSPSSSELNSSQVNLLLANAPYSSSTNKINQINANQIYGEKLVNYLRGDRTYEYNQQGDFRIRSSALGDIVHSDPIYVSKPNKRYLDSMESKKYSEFKATYANRIPVIYVGANDGMLHAFNANTGEEIMAYIPGVSHIYQNLPTLSYTSNNASSAYQHKYFVDGTPTVTDVFINDNWMSVLIGGLNAGGQGIYALDVTDPSTFSETGTSPASTVLWEFTDKDDPDLGFTYSKPQIAKVNYGNETRWAAIFGNGLNNTISDSNTSTTGQAVLYVVFIEKGIDGTWEADNDYIKIPVGDIDPRSPNGLSTPFLVDTNGDYVVDTVYAGDIKGNLWKFDLSSTTAINWKTATTKLFTAQMNKYGDQPITTPPVIIPHPTGLTQGVLVLFGTGKFIEKGDDSPKGQTTQSFYAIWDKNDGVTVLKSQLLQQTIKSESSQSYDTNNDGTNDKTIEVRDVSNHSINWTNHNGWYVDLIVDNAKSNNGERVHSITIIRNGRVVITTLVPSLSPCAFGGTSWLMELNSADGSRLDNPPFDFDGDGKFDKGDYINIGDSNNDGVDEYVPAGGIKSEVGISSTPTVLITEDKNKEIKVISGLEGVSALTENPGLNNKGRQNWRKLK